MSISQLSAAMLYVSGVNTNSGPWTNIEVEPSLSFVAIINSNSVLLLRRSQSLCFRVVRPSVRAYIHGCVRIYVNADGCVDWLAVDLYSWFMFM